MTRPPILFAAAESEGAAFAARWREPSLPPPRFVCVLAHTDTSAVPGLSAAGISAALRAFTPAADAEVVLDGRAHCLATLPSSPLGTPGPSGITRAAVRMAGLPTEFVGAGLRVWPTVPCRRIGDQPGGNIGLGPAVRDAAALFSAGQALGTAYAATSSRLVVGESVPGGTTTALALLLALGVAAADRVSGSVTDNAHPLKRAVVDRALARAELRFGGGRDDPLAAVCQVGDPMQPLAAGIALGALRAGTDVLLAGGSQMLGVAALMVALAGPDSLARVAIGTTRWIVADPAADVAGLAGEIDARLPVLAANLAFAHSRHPALRAYEDFRVKEGVGAGGSAVAAMLAADVSIEHLETAIDATYDGLLSRLT
jgi:uncharacterized protein (TIGR00303 family)